MSKKLFFVAGEASGDIHSAQIFSEIKTIHPDVQAEGLGGCEMASAGIKLQTDLTQHAVMGFTEVLQKYGTFKKIFKQTVKHLKDNPPDAVILVDYPGFNLKLAKAIRKENIQTKIIYYVSPKIWVWKEKRIETIRETVDHMLVLFEFEKDYYKNKHNYDVEWVGHPIIDEIKITKSREELLKKHHISNEKTILGIVPGSRQNEITRLLPIILKGAEEIQRVVPFLHCVLPLAKTIDQNLVQNLLDQSTVPVTIIQDDFHNVIHACDTAIVASGTASLEASIIGTPHTVVYKTSDLTWFIVERVAKVNYVSLVNIMNNHEVIPEILQHDLTPEKIANTVLWQLNEDVIRENMLQKFEEVKKSLGEPGVIKRTAEKILELI